MEPAAKDPILGVTEAFLADPSPDKVNVGVVSSFCLSPSISVSFFRILFWLKKKCFDHSLLFLFLVSFLFSLLWKWRESLEFLSCYCCFGFSKRWRMPIETSSRLYRL